MVKRLFLVLLVVFCVAGCGKSQDRTLKNLSYAELTALREIEIKHMNEEKNDSDDYFDAVRRLRIVNTLRSEAWEKERVAAGFKTLPTIEEMRAEQQKEIAEIKEKLKTFTP